VTGDLDGLLARFEAFCVRWPNVSFELRGGVIRASWLDRELSEEVPQYFDAKTLPAMVYALEACERHGCMFGLSAEQLVVLSGERLEFMAREEGLRALARMLAFSELALGFRCAGRVAAAGSQRTCGFCAGGERNVSLLTVLPCAGAPMFPLPAQGSPGCGVRAIPEGRP
jgi:hypothetical protein